MLSKQRMKFADDYQMTLTNSAFNSDDEIKKLDENINNLKVITIVLLFLFWCAKPKLHSSSDSHVFIPFHDGHKISV